jgi:D-serine deaminase-like pyridoxal phosphate-dependent protein
VFLARNGFDDILVAYPAWGELAGSGLCNLLKEGKTLVMMVDCAQHLEHLEAFGAAANVVIPICMDLDMSLRIPGILFGVRRSGIRTPEQAVQFWHDIEKHPHVSLVGIMGYEAQVASIPDRVPGSFMRNQVMGYLKRKSVSEVAVRRAAVIRALHEAGCGPRFVNGGGTGSLETTRLDGVVTELTAGSAFYAPALFDHFAAFKYEPAAGFAVEIVRQPAPGYFTCLGGGYVASGAGGADRLPCPYLPIGARLTPHEGAGEVQTPIRYDGPERLAIGDPVFMRHGKAGELCERFNRLYFVSQGNIVEEAPTYRGGGMCFL